MPEAGVPAVSLDVLDPYARRSSFTPADWKILADYWHPIAASEEVTPSAPHAATLLDVNLVVYRLASGLHVAADFCPHRGTRLSLGRIARDRLVCPYHGLEFDGGGVCTRVPGDTEGSAISRRLRIDTFASEERYGLIWVCLSGRPRAPIPDWGVLEQDGAQRCLMQGVWNTSPPRHLENFCDLAHFAYIHAGTFGSADHPGVPPYVVERRPHGLYFEVTVPMLDGSGFGGAYGMADIFSEYEVTFPFASRLTMHYSKGLEHICDVASPISRGRSKIFLLKSRDHDQDQSLDDWVTFQDAINEEDRVMVESQSPTWLPLGRGAEVHLGSDRFSVAYRKYWTDQGFGRAGEAWSQP
jgi:vanillate O-demethylase monooxygenase subunit